MGLSFNDYTYTGGAQTFPINFALGFIQRSDVTVRVNLAVDGFGDPVYAAFTWIDDSNITITDPLVVNDAILIERTVSKTELQVSFEDGADVTPPNLDLTTKQGLMVYQELIDGRIEGQVPPEESAQRAEAAALLAEASEAAAEQAVIDCQTEVQLAADQVTLAAAQVALATAQAVLADASAVAAAASAAAALLSENNAAGTLALALYKDGSRDLTGPLVSPDAVNDTQLPNFAQIKAFGDTEWATGASSIGATPPVAPEAGDQWWSTTQPIGMFVWYVDSDGGQWVQTNGTTPVDTTEYLPVEIVEADATAGWQVMGDTLIQWGTIDLVATRTVTFQQAFKTPPNVTASVSLPSGTASSNGQYVQGHEITATSCILRSYNGLNGLETNSRPASWIAIGEAPDALKKPKTVQAVGNSELLQYFDPSDVNSWELVGNKLTQWGRGTTDAAGNLVLVLTKTYAGSFSASAIAQSYSGAPADAVYSATLTATDNNSMGVQARFVQGAGTPQVAGSTAVSWMAVGEWDGNL